MHSNCSSQGENRSRGDRSGCKTLLYRDVDCDVLRIRGICFSLSKSPTSMKSFPSFFTTNLLKGSEELLKARAKIFQLRSDDLSEIFSVMLYILAGHT